MIIKKTDDLIQQLKKNNTVYNNYLSENKDCFLENDYSDFWNKVIKLSGKKKTDIINSADVGYTFFYDIIKGKKTPSRDTIIKIFIALQVDLEHLQNALRLYNWAHLYPKIKRDSIIIFAISHNYSLMQTEILLDEHSEKGLKAI